MSNPVVSTVRQMEARQSKNLIAAAEEMPADKYGYKPTPQQISFGHLVMHIAGSNNRPVRSRCRRGTEVGRS